MTCKVAMTAHVSTTPFLCPSVSGGNKYEIDQKVSNRVTNWVLTTPGLFWNVSNLVTDHIRFVMTAVVAVITLVSLALFVSSNKVGRR